MKPHDFEKYCRKHPAEPLDTASFGHCAVIPCYDENEAIGETLRSLAEAEKPFPVAVVLVVNDPPEGDAESSHRLLRRLESGEFSFLPHLFFCYAPALKGGVGAARKIGMDSYIASRNPRSVSESILFSLDADTLIAPGYFIRIDEAFRKNPDAAGVIPLLRHRQAETPEAEKAIRIYERYLDRYVNKLRGAGSPYAFHTVGSAFAVRGESYIRAGGMKVKTAGEDFYFLQELSKTGSVRELDEVLVHPSPRISRRVPFGTGVAVGQLLDGKPLPEIPDAPFDELRRVLAAAELLESFDRFFAELPPSGRKFLEAENFPAVWNKMEKNIPPTSGARLSAFHRWFDGLKTLRYLHSCKNNL